MEKTKLMIVEKDYKPVENLIINDEEFYVSRKPPTTIKIKNYRMLCVVCFAA